MAITNLKIKTMRNSLWKTSAFSIIALTWPTLVSAEKFRSTTAFLAQNDEKILASATPLKDAERQKSQAASKSVLELHSRLEIGGDYTYVTLQPHGHQTFHGNLGGAQALYEYKPMNRFYGAAKFAWKEGKTHGDAGRRSLLYFDVQERLGYTFASHNRHWLLTLFSGFGYRHLGQKFNPKEGDSLHFRYNEFYFPVGFLANYDTTRCFSIGVDFIWMPQVFPTLGIVPLKGAHWSIETKLANFFVALPLTFTLSENKRFLLTLKPFYERWQDGHTTAKLSNGTPLGIPGNTYNFYGADLNFSYKF